METCEHCGTPLVQPVRGRPQTRFCSRKCKDAARHAEKRAAKLATAGDRRCLECDTVIPGDVTLKAKCCSRKCGVAYQNRKRAEGKRAAWAAEGLHCERCNGPIPIPTTGRRRTKYCSQECKKQEMDERWRERSPHYNRQYLYGVTPADYGAALARQGGRCAICGTADWPGKDHRPHTDHDGETGVFRGVLCHNCNVGLGHFAHDPARLRAATDYLVRG